MKRRSFCFSNKQVFSLSLSLFEYGFFERRLASLGRSSTLDRRTRKFSMPDLHLPWCSCILFSKNNSFFFRLIPWYCVVPLVTCLGYCWLIQDGNKRIIVECGARRQQVILSSRSLSITKLRQLICEQFDLTAETAVSIALQMYDYRLNVFKSLNDENQRLDVMKDVAHLHRFRLANHSAQVQLDSPRQARPLQTIDPKEKHLLNDLRSTVGKLHDATRTIDLIQS